MNWQEAYHILDLSNPKTLEEVREAYSIQAKAWHPDRFESDAKMQRIGNAKMKLINEAFKFVKDNWSQRGAIGFEFSRASIPSVRRKTGPRDIVTVIEHGTSTARRTGLSLSAKRVHEYLGDATIIVIYRDHRNREVRLKVGEAAMVEFGRGAHFEIRLLQVRQVYKSKRGLPFPLFFSAADLAVTRLEA